MKRKFLVSCALGLFAFGVLATWLLRPPSMELKITLSFVGYTNNAWDIRHYRMLDPSDHKTALFQLTNHTGHSFDYSDGAVQTRTEARWADDPNWIPPDITESVVVGPGQSVLMDFPVPAGSNNWRCSVNLMDFTHHLARPNWQRQCFALMRRAGINSGRTYTIWSPEVVR